MSKLRRRREGRGAEVLAALALVLLVFVVATMFAISAMPSASTQGGLMGSLGLAGAVVVLLFVAAMGYLWWCRKGDRQRGHGGF